MRRRLVLLWVLLSLAGLGCSQRPPEAKDATVVGAEAPKPPASVSTSTQAKDLLDAAREAKSNLLAWVRPGAADPKNGWALAHGLIAYGPDLVASDGRKAIDVIASLAEVEGQGKKQRIVFPPRTKEGVVLQPHPGLMLKKMLEAGVPLSRSFAAPSGEKVTLASISADAFDTLVIPATDAGWHDFGWTLGALLIAYASEAPSAGAPKTAKQTKLVEASLSALARLEAEQAFLEPLMDAGRPDQVEKRKQQIYAYPCGGLHLMEAAIRGAAFVGTKDALNRARRQLAVLAFRWRAEREIYRRSVQLAPQFALLIHIQELKFFGHTLESLGLAAALGVLEKGSELTSVARQITQDLVAATSVLSKAYANLEPLRQEREQTYLDLIGDGCHAIRGLEEAIVAFLSP